MSIVEIIKPQNPLDISLDAIYHYPACLVCMLHVFPMTFYLAAVQELPLIQILSIKLQQKLYK